jgi:hypothetical protein
MHSIAIAPEEHKDLIRKIKRERKPSRRLRMHIVLLASDGFSPTQISRILYCSPTTVYAVVSRFVGGKGAAFFERRRRGPKPLLDGSAHESGSSVWWKRSRPPSMDGCAHAGAASCWPTSRSRSDRSW